MSKREWDPWKMYDITPSEKKAIQERAERRAALKAEWQKKVNNPYKSTAFIFDPAIQRFASMKVTHYNNFKMTKTTGIWGLVLFAIPFASFVSLTYYEKQTFEKKIRSGEITQRDRNTQVHY